MKFDWVVVSRDVLIVLLLGTVGAFTGGILVANLMGPEAWGGGPMGSFLGLSAGFCTVGCLTSEARAKHLGIVGAGAWLLGSVLGLAFGRTSFALVFGGELVAMVMAGLVGGALSWLIARPQRGPVSPRS